MNRPALRPALRTALIVLAASICGACAGADDFEVDAGSRPDVMAPGGERDQQLPPPDVGLVADGAPDAAPPADAEGLAPDALPNDARVGPTPEACAPLDVCGLTCADLDGDPRNCGECGRTCAVRDGMAACIDGMCAVGACDPGFFDTDGDPDNGCELESDCQPDVPCPTACETEGRVTCEGGAAVCLPPDEVCNGVDDNCAGGCDEGPLPGCRRPIHRASGNGHIFTDDLAQASRAPYRVEAQGFFHLYTEEHQGMRAVFLCRKPDGRYFLTNDTACEIGVAPQRTIGYWSPRPLCGSTPIYRMFSPDAGNHFYTISGPERDNAINNLGYLDEGTVGHVWRGP